MKINTVDCENCENKHCWLWKSYVTRKYTEFAKCGRFSGKCGYHCAVTSLFPSRGGSCSLRDAINSSNEAIPMFRAVQITIGIMFWEFGRKWSYRDIGHTCLEKSLLCHLRSTFVCSFLCLLVYCCWAAGTFTAVWWPPFQHFTRSEYIRPWGIVCSTAHRLNKFWIQHRGFPWKLSCHC